MWNSLLDESFTMLDVCSRSSTAWQQRKLATERGSVSRSASPSSVRSGIFVANNPLKSSSPVGVKYVRLRLWLRRDHAAPDGASIHFHRPTTNMPPRRGWCCCDCCCGSQTRAPIECFTTSLTLTLSSRRGKSVCQFSDFSMTTRPIQSQVFQQGGERFSFSSGEKAGMRASVEHKLFSIGRCLAPLR
jgi:hypothetical protein